jgi:hypothetical protein
MSWFFFVSPAAMTPNGVFKNALDVVGVGDTKKNRSWPLTRRTEYGERQPSGIEHITADDIIKSWPPTMHERPAASMEQVGEFTTMPPKYLAS